MQVLEMWQVVTFKEIESATAAALVQGQERPSVELQKKVKTLMIGTYQQVEVEKEIDCMPNRLQRRS